MPYFIPTMYQRIAERILERRDWPLSDNENNCSKDTVKTLEDALGIVGHVCKAFQIQRYDSIERDLCAIMQDSNSPYGNDTEIDMDNWARVANCLVQIHKPSARHVAWLVSLYAIRMGSRLFISSFSGLQPIVLEYITQDMSLSAKLEIWANHQNWSRNTNTGPFTLEFAKNIMRRNPEIYEQCYYRLYFSVMLVRGISAFFELASVHNVHFVDALTVIASENINSLVYLLRVPAQFSISVDELSQLYAHDSSHPWTSVKSASRLGIVQEDLDFINRHRDKVVDAVYQVIPIKSIALEIREFLFESLPVRFNDPILWSPFRIN